MHVYDLLFSTSENSIVVPNVLKLLLCRQYLSYLICEIRSAIIMHLPGVDGFRPGVSDR